MQLWILRVVFVLVAIGIATLLSSTLVKLEDPIWLLWLIFLGTLALAGGTVAADIFVPRKPIDVISAVYFGLLVGVFLTYVVMLVLTPLMPEQNSRERWDIAIRTATPLILGMVLCYVCISLLIQTKDDFRFIIPFATQIGLYVSPVGFSSKVVPPEWFWLYSINPMVGVIDGFRWCILGGESPIYWPGFLISLLVILVMLACGAHAFRRTERAFADII